MTRGRASTLESRTETRREKRILCAEKQILRPVELSRPEQTRGI